MERKITEIIIKLWSLRYHVLPFLSIEIVKILACVWIQELQPSTPAPYCSRVLIRYINFFLDPRGKLIRWESNWFICFCPTLVYLPGTASYHPAMLCDSRLRGDISWNVCIYSEKPSCMTWRNFAGRRQPVRIIPYLYLGRRVEGRTCALNTVPFPKGTKISGQVTKIFAWIIASVLSPFPIHYTVFAWEDECTYVSYPLKVGGKELLVCMKKWSLLSCYMGYIFRMNSELLLMWDHIPAILGYTRHPKQTEG